MALIVDTLSWIHLQSENKYITYLLLLIYLANK